MRILIISPIPSHPQDQGNSARLYVFARSLQRLGHLVHLLYYPLEGLSPEQHAAMSFAWDGFHTLPCSVVPQSPLPEPYFNIDAWFSERLGNYAADLHQLWGFDIAVVNYVWMSATLDYLPNDLLKIIDTHDVFGGRAETFTSIGLKPEWFYTSPEQERIGLLRAHIVLAIQSAEEGYLRNLIGNSSTQVVTLGYAATPRYVRQSTPVGAHNHRPLVGYIGSGNPFNVAAVKGFLDELQNSPELLRSFDFVFAGSICRSLPENPLSYKLLGRVDSLEIFYSQIDIAINPMTAGTGLKIKTLEALSFGVPLLGTADAWMGVATAAEVHPYCYGSKVSALLSHIASSGELTALKESCTRLFRSYLLRQLETTSQLFPTRESLYEKRNVVSS
jgi:glycosyltransferase involved in cell wall biosynthesis